MSWQRLLGERRVARHEASRHEIESLRALVERDLDDAAVEELSSDRRFATAYSAALGIARMIVAAAGYRVRGEGAHRTTLEALGLAMGGPATPFCAYLELCRRMRNRLAYDVAGVVSESEAIALRRRVEQFKATADAWLRRHHPALC